MDYSLLLGIHYKDRPIPDRLRSAANTKRERKDNGRDSEGGMEYEDDDDMIGAGSGVATGSTAPHGGSASLSAPVSIIEEKHSTSSPSVPSHVLQSPPQPSRSDKVDSKAMTALEEPPHSPRKKGRTRSYGGGGDLDHDHLWDRTRITRANTAFMPDTHSHATLDGDDTLQSNYGLPRRYNKISRPGDIKFKAPAFQPVEIVPVLVAKAEDKHQEHQRKNSIEPVQSLFTKEDGGVSSQNMDGSTGNELYYMGVIDILTEYGTKKKLEHGIKSVNHKSSEISAVNPSAYAERFKKFLKSAIS